MKIPRIFPQLYSISDFLNREYPILHPDSGAYLEYWEKEEQRCLEGKWGFDSRGKEGGWRYMPPALYFYVNYCVIIDEDDRGKSTDIIHPLLRDIEWIIHYAYITAQGFSGFEEDDVFTCNRLVEKLENNLVLSPKEQINLDKCQHVLNSSGKPKKYIEAREYLYKTFDRPLGKPVYENDLKGIYLLSSRSGGKSFCAAGIMAHCYNFYNKKFYDEKYLNNPAPAELLIGAAQSGKSADLVNKFLHMQEYLKKVPGSWGKGDDFIPGYFFNNSVGKTSVNNASSPYRHEYKVQEGKIWVTRGTGTRLIHVAYADNAEAGVGYRPNLLVLEEIGLFDNLLQVHSANEFSMMRKNRTGVSFYLGTGGNIDKIVEPKIIFEDPEAYDFLSYPDLWENRSKPIGLFIPAYYTDNTFKDELGNTDIESAYAQELLMRKKKEAATNSMALDGYMMSRPLVPSEMFLSSTANLYPTARLRQREAEIETRNLFNVYASIGDLDWADPDKKTVRWREDLSSKRDHRVITTMNLDQYKTNMNGAIVIYEHPPEYIPAPSYKKSLYKVVYDPVKDDNGGTSLAAVLVHKGFAEEWNSGLQDTIVAEYIGRYDSVDEIHDIVLKIAHYFNATVLVENNLPGFINYCKINNYIHKLQICPYEAIAKGIQTYGKKYEYGVTMSGPLNVHCEQLIRQWLLEPWKKENDELKYSLDKLLSLRLIRELITYDRKGNFDMISALKILVLWLSQERDVIFKEEDVKYDPYEDLNKYFKQIVSTKQKNPWYA